jgi:dolichol-phosphate mannosyltransferase
LNAIRNLAHSKPGQVIRSAAQKFGILRFCKFCLVGATGTAVNMGLLWLLTEFASFPYLVSSAISIETSIIVNFSLHSFFTFSDQRPSTLKAFFRRLLPYNLVSLAGLAINMGILWLLTEKAGLYYLLANLIGIVTVTLWRYLVSRRWIWKQRDRS